MILFLDFDGVLHPLQRSEPDFSRLPLLWKILRACPHVEVVLSTSWREIYRPDEMIEFVTYGGGEDLAHRIIGSTPERLSEPGAFIYVAGRPYHRRHIECELWLTGNKQTDHPWLAIDDIAKWFPPDSPNLYLIDGKLAMTETDAEKIIAKLKEEKP
jgi:hypothetical protein